MKRATKTFTSFIPEQLDFQVNTFYDLNRDITVLTTNAYGVDLGLRGILHVYVITALVPTEESVIENGIS